MAAITTFTTRLTFDSAIAQFQRWLSTPAGDGHPKCGLLNVFGIGGLNALGHLLTPHGPAPRAGIRLHRRPVRLARQRRRLGHDRDSRHAGREQLRHPGDGGDSAAYPRGWLGFPTGAAVRVAAGEWKRTFTGGRVYANASSSAWSVDDQVVPAQDGLFVRH